MPIRTLVMMLAVALPFSAVAEEKAKAKARTDSSAPSKPTGVGYGEACKVDADCDQSGRAMLCGKGKCEYDVSKIPVKT